jgi:hypothetical protein
LALIALVLSFCAAGWGAGSDDQATTTGGVLIDCARCATLHSEIESQRVEEQKMSAQLESQRAELKTLPADNVSKRMKMTSSIFVLVAKVETAQNKRLAREGEVQKLKCGQCPHSGL